MAPLITGRLRNLKSLEISLSCWSLRTSGHRILYHVSSKLPESHIYWDRVTQVRLLLESFSSLEIFSGYHLPQCILTTLSSRHPLLKHLRFRNFNRQRDYSAQDPFPPSIEELVNLPAKLPNLESLGLDLDWEHEEWVCLVLPFDRLMNHNTDEGDISHME